MSLFAAVLLAFSFASTPSVIAQTESSSVTFVQALPDSSVDLYVNGDYESPLVDDASFQSAAELDLVPGTYTLEVYPSDADPNVVDPILGPSSLEVLASTSHSAVAGLNTDADPTLFFFVDDVSATNGDARLVIRHVADAATLEARVNGQAVSSQLLPGNFVQTTVSPGENTLELVNAEDTSSTILPERTLDLDANTVVFVYAAGSTDASIDTFDVFDVVVEAQAPPTTTTTSSTTTTAPTGVPTGDGSSLGGGSPLMLAIGAAAVALISAVSLARFRRFG